MGNSVAAINDVTRVRVGQSAAVKGQLDFSLVCWEAETGGGFPHFWFIFWFLV